MKKLLTVLVVCCLVAVCSVTTLATEPTEGTCGENLTWTLENGTLTISGAGDMENYGYNTAPWYSQRSGITKVVVESGVTGIGSDAFYGCASLTSVTLPEGTSRIGKNAFYNCTELTDIAFPEGVTAIEEMAFAYCIKLTEVTIPDSVTTIGKYAFFSCSSLADVTIGSGVTDMRGNAFSACNNLHGLRVDENNPVYTSDETGVVFSKDKTKLVKVMPSTSDSYTVPETVTVIGESAFLECSNLTAIILPRNLKTIEQDAFRECDGLTTIDIPQGVTSIGSGAFMKCASLTAATIPDGVTELSRSIFWGCEILTTVTLPDGLTDIGYNAFSGCSDLAGINIPGTVETIGGYAFQQCYGLKDVSIGEGVKRIGVGAFSGCISLEEIDIPNSVTEIYDDAFSVCRNLTSIEIPYGVTYIGSETFYNCRALTYITIPETVTSIGSSAFQRCAGLTHIVIPATVTSIGEAVFEECTSLSMVHYTGSVDQKAAITISEYNDVLLNTVWHCDLATYVVQGQKVHHCPECDMKFLADGSAYHGVVVGGVGVTPDNCADIFDDGSASYDFDTKTLTLNNADFTVTDQDYGIFAEDDLTISLVGDNTVTVANPAGDMPILAGIYTGGDLKLCGEGELRVYMEENATEKVYGIRVLGAMTLEARVTVDGSYRITSPLCGVHADIIYANAPELICYCETAITVDTGIYIAEKLRVQNAQEGFTEGVPCTLTSSVHQEWPVTIGYKKYWISYDGIDITSENADDIMGDGTVYYDEETDTITLNNANHTISGIGGGYWPGTMSINVNVIGENHLTIKDGNFIYTHDGHVSISGSGSLYLDITTDYEFGACGIYASYVSISVDRLDINIDYVCAEPSQSEYDEVDARGIYTSILKLSGRELNIDVTSNLDAYGIFMYGGDYTDGMKNQCTDISIQTATTNPAQYTAAAIHAFAPFAVNGGRMELMGDTAIDALYPITLPDGYVVENAAEEFVSGTTTKLTQADPDVPVVIEPKPVVAPTLTGTGFTLSFEDEILVNFYYTAENTQDIAQQGMLVFYADPGVADFAKADDVYTGSASSDGVFANTTKGIAAKEMGDERYYCAYAKLSDGTYAYSPLYYYSPEKYAMGRLENSSNEELKALCVAMLNYGAAAQKYFGYRTDDLMNDRLTEEQQALVTAFDVALFAGAIPADSAKAVNFVQTETGFTKRNASVSFEGAFAINYYFTPEFAVEGDMQLHIWSPEDYEAAEVLTADNAVTVTMENRDGTYFAPISGIAPKELDKTYYVAGVYTDADGNIYCTGVIAYSLSRYCMNNAQPGKNMQELAANTAMYGYYADQYFA